jgi:hypothetical protein
MKQAKNETQALAIELIKNLYKKYKFKIKKQKMFIKGKHDWEDSVYLFEGIKKMKNTNFLIEVFICENNDFYFETSKSRKTIIAAYYVYENGLKKYIFNRKVFVNEYKTVEQYLDKIQNELEEMLFCLNSFWT